MTEKIPKNSFSLLNTEKAKKIVADFGVTFMNRLQSATVHRPLQVDEMFESELYGAPAWFFVEHSDEMHQGKENSIQDHLQLCHPLLLIPKTPKHLSLKLRRCYRNCQVSLLIMFISLQ